MLSILSNTHFEIIWPLLLLPLPLLVYFLVPAKKQDSAALQVPFYDRLQALSEQESVIKKRLPYSFWLLLLAWSLSIIAMCRPVLFGDAVQISSQARDLYLAVDISGSMEERDMLLNNQPVRRISLVKSVLGDFIQRRQGDRIGLILFADNAYIQAPLTFDSQTVNQLLQEAQLGFAGQKTAIGDALGLGIKQLVERPNDSRTIILLTDGANNAGRIKPEEAATVASENQIKVYTVAIGGDARYRNGLFGSSIPPRRSANIDEETLKAIANITGGNYFRADNSAELDAIYHQLDKLEPVDQEVQTFRPQQQLYHWPLALALLLISALTIRELLHFVSDSQSIDSQQG